MVKIVKKQFKLFDVKSAPGVRTKLMKALEFPYVRVQISTLCGDMNVLMHVTISKDPKNKWVHGILHNSRYAMISIENNGVVRQFAGQNLKMRGFTAKDINHMIKRINAIKVK